MKILAVAALIAVGTLAHGQDPDSISKWAVAASGYGFHPDILYTRAGGQDLRLDVITIGPKADPKPTVLYFHGGGWVGGTRQDKTLASLPFLAAGMDFVNVDYRLAKDGLAPAAVEDCRCALRWVYRNAKDYGFDTAKIVVVGESAGAHLALMTGMVEPSDGFDYAFPALDGEPPLRPAAIVSYSGPTDIADLLEGPHLLRGAVKWLGNPPDRAALARRLSPLSYVRPGLPPIILVAGNPDPVPHAEADRLHEALDKAGDPNVLITIPGPIHGWLIEKREDTQRQVLAALEKYGVIRGRVAAGAAN